MQILLKIKNYLLYEKSGSDDQMRALVVFLVILVEAILVFFFVLFCFILFFFIKKGGFTEYIQKTLNCW